MSDHWQIYIGALLASLLGTVPLILADERKGKSSTLTTAIVLLAFGQLLLASATLTALLADATREEVRTRTMAVLGIAIGSSFLLALIVGPVIAAAGGVRILFWLAAALALVAAVLLLFLQ